MLLIGVGVAGSLLFAGFSVDGSSLFAGFGVTGSSLFAGSAVAGSLLFAGFDVTGESLLSGLAVICELPLAVGCGAADGIALLTGSFVALLSMSVFEAFAESITALLRASAIAPIIPLLLYVAPDTVSTFTFCESSNFI